jgi:hypothetical protein
VPAIDQNRKLDAPGAAEIIERIHRRSRGPAPEEDIVHEHDGLIIDVEWNDGGMDLGRQLLVEVIAMHAYIEIADRHIVPPNISEQAAQPLPQMHSATLHTDDHHRPAVVISLGDLMGDARKHAIHGGGIQDNGPFRHKKIERTLSKDPFDANKNVFIASLAISQDRLKGGNNSASTF